MVSLPLFFQAHIPGTGMELEPAEDTARHIVQVLRMQEGEMLLLADGQGIEATARISQTTKKSCRLRIESLRQHSRKQPGLHLCVGFTKNSSRNEWLLEKATELGVHSITPLQTSRTEREKFRHDRWNNILVSAMLQSQQFYLPELRAVTALSSVVASAAAVPRKIVAHCMEELPRQALSRVLQPGQDAIILIGPEGDLSAEEVELCTAAGFSPVSLCMERLRTETAAMAVCAFFNLLNHE